MSDLTARLAARLRDLREARGLSLDALARLSGVSRATLSRIETGETSPTAEVLGRLAHAHDLPISGLMRMVESGPRARLPRAEQEVWEDPATGFRRRDVSPPAEGFSGHVIEGHLPPGAAIRYAAEPRSALEHHLVMLDGTLRLATGGAEHDLGPGDCLRYRLTGPSAFEAGPGGARYHIFIL
ncbi:MAG: helix-turn-helix domain-containing protein [Pseudooceanicola sp.]